MTKTPDIPCVPNPDCKYFDRPTGCFEDNHHIYRQHEATTALKKDFCRLAVNQVVLCRAVHEEWEAAVGWPQYPSRQEMKRAVNGN